jgi:hypothetical protein
VLLALAVLLLLGAAPAKAEPAPDAEAELMREVEAANRLAREARAAEERAARSEREAQEAEERAQREMQEQRARALAAPLEAEIQDQQAIQGDLVWAATGRGRPRETDERLTISEPLGPGPEGADPRIASPAPAPRELPIEIFDRSREVIAPGTWGNAKELVVIRLVLDADGDGKPELIRFVRKGNETLLREEADRNYDGVIDAWTVYRDEAVATRVLDSNDDGNPDVFESYHEGRLSSREIDRDDDGVRDVFYRYEGASLAEEKHDANNDGAIDLVIIYRERLRVRAEEDVDRDGRMDVWTRYVARAGVERVSRIERDEKGRGYADTFEIFETRDERTVLLRREQDINGDGEIDVVSFYVGGKLRRRQISNPDVVPM